MDKALHAKIQELPTDRILDMLRCRGTGKTRAMMLGAQAAGRHCTVVVARAASERPLRHSYPGDYNVVSLIAVAQGALDGSDRAILLDAEVLQDVLGREQAIRRELEAALEAAEKRPYYRLGDLDQVPQK